MRELVIFGAQGYALGVYEAMKVLQPRRVIPFFMVSSLAGNPAELAGVPVREIAEVAREFECESEKDPEGCASPDDVEVIIATPENVMPEIERTLESYGFHNYVRLTSDRWDEMMKLFHIKLGRFRPLSALPVGCEKPGVDIYMAKFYKDKELSDAPVLPEYVHPLQVGAANTDVRVAELTDDMPYSISYKNGNYCELTGLYWLWKNRLFDDGYQNSGSTGAGSVATNDSKKRGCSGDEAYFGLCQYRRMFLLSDDDLTRLASNDVDVVLPFPLPYEPDINEHHKRYLKDADWDALLSALKEIQPEYAKYFSGVLGQKYLYNYNVILAKKSVLRDYCEWLFPILERTEELSEPKGCDRSDRYIGYMGETLETLYFMKNADRLNIVHTTCKLYT